MVKGNDVRQSLDKFGFESLREGSGDQSYRFKTTAVHPRHGVRVVISAPQRFMRVQGHSARHFSRRQVNVEVMDGACRPLPGTKPVIIVNRLCEIDKILQSIANGDLCRNRQN